MLDKNAYMREYMNRRYHKRRDMAIEFLGGKCVECGTDLDLQIDHINPKEKKYEPYQACSALSEAKFWEEIKKCQLLCRSHHAEKTVLDVGNKLARGTHGTLSAFRYCKCSLCRDAYNKYRRGYMRVRRAKQKKLAG